MIAALRPLTMSPVFRWLGYSLLAALLVTAASFAGAQDEAGAAASAAADITITFTNDGARAWRVVATEGEDAERVAELRVDNAPLWLELGKRYRIVNEGGRRVHPFGLASEEGFRGPLLTQSADAGAFEADREVAFEKDDEGITFTLTPALAESLHAYYCTAHPNMTGLIEIRGLD